MTRLQISTVCVACHLLVAAIASAQSSPPRTGSTATVRITEPVLAGGQSLVPGTYEIRITGERPEPLVGQSADAQRKVEILQGGTVVAREVAEVLPLDEAHPIGTSFRPRAQETRVELLKGGDFLRVSISDSESRYLIHLPIAAASNRP